MEKSAKIENIQKVENFPIIENIQKSENIPKIENADTKMSFERTKRGMSLQDLLEIRKSLLKSIDFANTLVDLKSSQADLRFHTRKESEISQSYRDLQEYDQKIYSMQNTTREHKPQTERQKFDTKLSKQTINNYIKEKFTIMMKKAAQRSNAARSKIREQIAILRSQNLLNRDQNKRNFTESPKIIKLEKSSQLILEKPIIKKSPLKSTEISKNKAKIRYDESLVDLIDSIENEPKTETILKQIPKNNIEQKRFSYESLNSLPKSSKVYYPKHQLFKSIQSTKI